MRYTILNSSRTYIVFFLLVLGSRVPFLFQGFGLDPNAWGVALAVASGSAAAQAPSETQAPMPAAIAPLRQSRQLLLVLAELSCEVLLLDAADPGQPVGQLTRRAPVRRLSARDCRDTVRAWPRTGNG